MLYIFSNLRLSYTTEFGPGGIQTHNVLVFEQTPKFGKRTVAYPSFWVLLNTKIS